MKIAFGLYNQLTHKSESYQKHLRDITLYNLIVALGACSDSSTETILVEGDDISDIILDASKQNADHLFLVSMGYQSNAHTLALQVIEEAQVNNYPIVGHILEDKSNGYYYFHDQTLYIDLAVWKNIGFPKFGKKTSVSAEIVSLPERSPEDIHDDYTPTYLKPSNTTIKHTGHLNPGACLISDTLAAGYTVGNFSNEVRNQKYHLYPDIADDRLERILNGEQGITIEPVGPYYGQYKYLTETDFTGFQDSVFVFNNEPLEIRRMEVYNTNIKIDTLYAVASGFKPIKILTYADWSAARVVYIDYSQPALDFKKWLVDTWDGKDYITKVNEYKSLVPSFNPVWLSDKDYTPEWDKTVESFGGEEDWLSIWNRYRNLPHEYIKIDLFGDYSDMIQDMKMHTGHNIIWFSNSFFTGPAIRHFKPSVLTEKYQQFVEDVKQVNSSIQLCGCDNAGAEGWIHHNSTIKEFFNEEPWTMDFSQQQVPNFSDDDAQLGNWIVHKSGWPYLPLELPDAPYEDMLREALAVSYWFVPHRESCSLGWKSACLYGEEWDKTDHFSAYPENAGKQAHEIIYKWTEVADRCPITTEYLKNEFPHTLNQRIRFMWLEPQGYILPHQDRTENYLSPINIALNNPYGCMFKMKDKGYVPFSNRGSACLVDIGNIHSVWNNSNTPRIHIISHGTPKISFPQLVAHSFKKMVYD